MIIIIPLFCPGFCLYKYVKRLREDRGKAMILKYVTCEFADDRNLSSGR